MADAFDPVGVNKPFGVFSTAAWQPEGRVLHIAGLVAQDAAGNPVAPGDTAGQTRQVLDNIVTVLDSVGGTLDDVVSMVVYVTHLADLMKIHEVRRAYFHEPYPASTLVQVAALVKPQYMIEITATEVIPFDRVRQPQTR